MGEEFTATYSDGPEFEEGDRVIIVDGPFSGQPGIVYGYDPDHEAYLVDFGGDCRAPFQGSSLELALEQLDTDALPEILDLDDEIEVMDRVVITRGPWTGQAGWVVQEEPRATVVFGMRVVVVVTENRETISIGAHALIRSPYQDEEDLDAIG